MPNVHLVFLPLCYEGLVRSTSVARPQLEAAAEALARCLHKSALRNHPDAVQATREVGGDEAYWEAVSYTASVGFPRQKRKVKAASEDSVRRTPAAVRALWKTCHEAVEEWSFEYPLEPHERAQLTLQISWGSHAQAMLKFARYREDVRARHSEDLPGSLWLAYAVIIDTVRRLVEASAPAAPSSAPHPSPPARPAPEVE
jgi:hypothetical protein